MKRAPWCAAVMLACVPGCLAVDPVLLNLVMPDARAVAGVDVSRALSSPLGQFLLSETSPQAQQQLEKVRQLTGFDPRSDLREILVAAPGGQSDQRRLAAATGAFDPARIVAAARAGGAEVDLYQGVEVVSFSSRGKHPAALAFLSNSLAVSGDPDSVRLAIDRHRRSGPALDRRLAARIAAVSAGADAWFVSLIPGAELPPAGAGPQAGVLAVIEQASGSLQLGATVVAAGEVVATTPQDAAALADVVRLLVSLVRLNRQDPRAAALAEILNSLEVSAAGVTVRLRLAVPQTQIESLIRTLRPR